MRRSQLNLPSQRQRASHKCLRSSDEELEICAKKFPVAVFKRISLLTWSRLRYWVNIIDDASDHSSNVYIGCYKKQSWSPTCEFAWRWFFFLWVRLTMMIVPAFLSFHYPGRCEETDRFWSLTTLSFQCVFFARRPRDDDYETETNDSCVNIPYIHKDQQIQRHWREKHLWRASSKISLHDWRSLDINEISEPRPKVKDTSFEKTTKTPSQQTQEREVDGL